jgi:uncharacterized protein YlxP (DUF503 family)
VHAAALRFELYLRGCRSLKAKRAVIKPILEGARRRYRVSSAEVEHQANWHRAGLGFAAVAASPTHLAEVLDAVERFVWSFPEVEVIEVQRSSLEVDV